MININSEKCVGCGLCVKDCFLNDIEVVNGKAKVKNIACLKCGHCIAICPNEAVSIDEYNMEDVKKYNKDEFNIEPDVLLNFIKFRRTVRQFKDKDVENEKLSKIIEAGRFTQTGSNSQDVSYVVVKDNIEKVKEVALRSLKVAGEQILNNLNPQNIMYERYAKMWMQMYRDYKENPSAPDKLFFKAPAIIVVVSNSDVNGALASSNMELMTNTLGLGTFFSGFFVRAANGNKEIMDLLGLNETQKIVTCMVIGYPNIKYTNTAPRKDAVISWK